MMDVWFDKPRLRFRAGKWECETCAANIGIVYGFGANARDAFNDMKTRIMRLWPRSKVTFATNAEGR